MFRHSNRQTTNVHPMQIQLTQFTVNSLDSVVICQVLFMVTINISFFLVELAIRDHDFVKKGNENDQSITCTSLIIVIALPLVFICCLSLKWALTSDCRANIQKKLFSVAYQFYFARFCVCLFRFYGCMLMPSSIFSMFFLLSCTDGKMCIDAWCYVLVNIWALYTHAHNVYHNSSNNLPWEF